MRKLALRVFVLYTKLVYFFIARAQTRRIQDYLKHGYMVTTVAGIDGFPSCGVNLTIDIGKGLHGLCRNLQGKEENRRVVIRVQK
jgi:hypothetical protein